MTISEFKKIGRLLKEAYKELEATALAQGADVFSGEYEEARNRLRETILRKFGFTLEEYREAKEQYEQSRKEKKGPIDIVLDRALQLKGEKGDTVVGEKGDKGDKGDRGEKGDKGDPGKNGKDGKDGMPGRDGRDGKDGADGKDGRDGFVDEATVGYLESEVKTANESVGQFKKELTVLQESIKGMPDFRKLGMGLQAQVDTKVEGVNVTRLIASATQPTDPRIGDIWLQI